MSYTKSRRSTEILLVEDNRADALLVQEALKTCDPSPHLSMVEDGDLALAFLRRQGHYANAPRPDLILLNLRMPHKDGLEVLAEIKQDLRLRCIPVLIFTSSVSPDDIKRSYALQANAYIVKPTELDRFIAIIQEIEHFWGTVVSLFSEQGSLFPEDA